MIELTERAAEKIIYQLDKRGKGLGIKLAVKTTGCSGLAYVLEYVDKENPTDLKVMQKNCTIYVDPKSEVYLNGITVDFVKKGLSEGFDFINPNERARCGCGSSFTV